MTPSTDPPGGAGAHPDPQTPQPGLGPGPAKKLRVAAVGDLHVGEAHDRPHRELFDRVHEDADVLCLCGDLTNFGKTREVEILLEDLRGCQIPMVGVLGNHEHECGHPEVVTEMLCDAGVRMLTGPGTAGGVAMLRMAVIEACVVMLTEFIVIRSLSLLPAPMWKVCGAVEARTAKSLKRVFWMVREVSAASCWNSASRLALSSALFVPLADWTASSRIRCSISPILPRAPSAT